MLATIGRAISGVELQQARDAAQEAGRAMAKFHQRYDLLITASAAHPPVRIGELALKRSEKLGLGLMRMVPFPAAVLRKVLDTVADSNLHRTPNTQLCNQTGQRCRCCCRCRRTTTRSACS